VQTQIPVAVEVDSQEFTKCMLVRRTLTGMQLKEGDVKAHTAEVTE
jgi:hypothetical protein